jgi:hypothetical protein
MEETKVTCRLLISTSPWDGQERPGLFASTKRGGSLGIDMY